MVFLTACWSSSSQPPPPAPEPIHNAELAAPLEVEPVPHHTVWRGKYTCRQGVTALQLTIDVDAQGEATAVFDFGPHTGNPAIPSGSYRMLGTVRESGAKLQVRLQPDKWINQPEGYMMVGINADSDRERHRLTGWITDEGCAGVELRRTQ